MPRTLPQSKHLDAAAMLAKDVPITEIARQMGVTRPTIYNWSQTPEAQAHIAAIRDSVAEATKHLAVADIVRRINLGQEMVDGILAVIRSRREAGIGAQNPLPGEKTGHVAVKTETLSNFVTKREAAFDASLHSELRKWLEYVAKEKGELESKINVRHSGGIDHVIAGVDLSRLSDETLEHLAEIREVAIAREHAEP